MIPRVIRTLRTNRIKTGAIPVVVMGWNILKYKFIFK